MTPRSNNAGLAHNRSGFTLIEISIVLVIVGLLVGGVLVGKDLISAAEIRSTISDINKHKTTYRSFELKYDCIPGDCPNANQFGFGDYWNSGGAASNGDGDGKIYSFADGSLLPSGAAKLLEARNALIHLFNAGFMDFYGSSSPANSSNLKISGAFMWMSSLRPSPAPVGYVMPDKDTNYLVISKYPANSGIFTPTLPILTTQQAYAIDSKMDDGLPMSGAVRPSWYYYSCMGTTFSQGPCFNTPIKKSNAVDGNAVGFATVDDTVSPPIYNVNSTDVLSGYEVHSLTMLNIAID